MRPLLRWAVAAAVCASVPAIAWPQDAAVSPTSEASAVSAATLSSGLRLWTLARPWSPRVSASLVCERAGDEDRAQDPGVAHVAIAALSEAITARCGERVATVMSHGDARVAVQGSDDAVACAVRTVALVAQTGAVADDVVEREVVGRRKRGREPGHLERLGG